MTSSFKHIGNYKCICGKEFTNSQVFNGHKLHCKDFQISKYGSLDNYNKMWEKISQGVKEHYKSISEKIKLENSLKEQEELDQWISEKHICERCGKVMTEKFGSGRFCSRACANARDHSDETKLKISNTLTGNNIDLEEFLQKVNNNIKNKTKKELKEKEYETIIPVVEDEIKIENLGDLLEV